MKGPVDAIVTNSEGYTYIFKVSNSNQGVTCNFNFDLKMNEFWK